MFRIKRLLIMNGGLGNQLFQFSFLHKIYFQSGKRLDIYFPNPKDGAREFALGLLCRNCNHVNRLRLNRSMWVDLASKIIDFLKFRNPRVYKSLISKFHYSEVNSYEYEYENGLIHKHIYSGYFQNWKYVDEVINEVEKELMPFLESQLENVFLRFPRSDYAVLHFRRGDLLKYSETMGVLDADYFSRALETAMADVGRELRLIVLTDDRQAAIQELTGFIAEIYGPADLSEWQALALMSKAKFVITSNSTFSWWGGLLASRNGGSVYIPNPWFLDWNPNPGDAFRYPGFITVHSTFR